MATLLAGGAPGTPAKPPYFWSDQYGVRIQFAGIAGPDEDITFEEGGPDERRLPGRVPARSANRSQCSGVDQPRLFTQVASPTDHRSDQRVAHTIPDEETYPVTTVNLPEA